MSAEFEFALGLVPIPAEIVSADGSIVSSNAPFRERVGATESLSLADFDIDLGTEIDRGNGRLHRITHQAEGGGSADSIAILRPIPADESRFLILLFGEEFAPEDERELRELARFPLVNPSPVLRLDKDGQIVACNPAAERLFGDDDLAQAQWIDAAPSITTLARKEILGVSRTEHLEKILLRDRDSGAEEELPMAAMFVFIGAAPHTDLVAELVERNDKGFIPTGPDLRTDGKRPKKWQLHRDPFPFKTSIPGIFAAGDVRSGSSKRVAAAVGEGSGTVGMVHRYLETV